MQTKVEIHLHESDPVINYDVRFEITEGYNSRGSFPYLKVLSAKDEEGKECVDSLSDEAMTIIEDVCEKAAVKEKEFYAEY